MEREDHFVQDIDLTMDIEIKEDIANKEKEIKDPAIDDPFNQEKEKEERELRAKKLNKIIKLIKARDNNKEPIKVRDNNKDNKEICLPNMGIMLRQWKILGLEIEEVVVVSVVVTVAVIVVVTAVVINNEMDKKEEDILQEMEMALEVIHQEMGFKEEAMVIAKVEEVLGVAVVGFLLKSFRLIIYVNLTVKNFLFYKM